jgi:hypothetical protein
VGKLVLEVVDFEELFLMELQAALQTWMRDELASPGDDIGVWGTTIYLSDSSSTTLWTISI